MSKTVPVSFRGRNLWAFDVSLSVLLAELIGVMEGLPPAETAGWPKNLLHDLRVHAICGADLHFDLDLGLTDGQRHRLLELIAEANRRVRHRGTITAAEAAAWEVLDGHSVIWRSALVMDTAPIVELGEALTALVQGSLAYPPAGSRWFFGASGGATTIPVIVDDSG
jgi:hypothetical protein